MYNYRIFFTGKKSNVTNAPRQVDGFETFLLLLNFSSYLYNKHIISYIIHVKEKTYGHLWVL